MKSTKLACAIATVIASGYGVAAFAEEVSLYDYEQATSAYEDAYINAQFNLQNGNQAQTSYDLDLNLDYEKVFTSADQNTKLDFVGETSRSRGPNVDDATISHYQASGAITNDNYFQPNSNGAFWYGKGEIGAQKGMDDPYTKATVGIGYGRVVNATPMAKAIRLVEALVERRLITEYPSKATYQAVANVIAREDEYVSKYGSDEYELTWLEDIEAALGSSLGVKGAIKSYDVLTNERISTRKHGWLVRAGVGAVLSDYDGSSSKPALEIGAEYHRPLNNKTQFSNESVFTAVLDDNDDSYRFANTMSLTYEVSDRVDWENAWLLDYVDYETSNDITTNALSSTYRYYISNALSFSVTAQLTSLEDNIDNNGNDKLDKSLVMGLTYRMK